MHGYIIRAVKQTRSNFLKHCLKTKCHKQTTKNANELEMLLEGGGMHSMAVINGAQEEGNTSCLPTTKKTCEKLGWLFHVRWYWPCLMLSGGEDNKRSRRSQSISELTSELIRKLSFHHPQKNTSSEIINFLHVKLGEVFLFFEYCCFH